MDLTRRQHLPGRQVGGDRAGRLPEAHLLPSPSEQPPLPAPCSASAHGGCPTATSTLFQSSSFGDPVAVVPAVPPTWNTALSGEGYYVAFDDATVRRVGAEAPVVVAGSAGGLCEDRTSPCGDGGPATAALLAQPSGLAVGLDGSLYIADVLLRRVRKVDPSGVITTVAGTGAECDDGICGDGGPATSAQLDQPFGVAVDPYGVLLIADGTGGVRRVAVDGTISTLTPRSDDVYQSVATGADGTIYAATQFPDRIVKIDPATGAVTPVVGTGTSGYNGNTDELRDSAAGHRRPDQPAERAVRRSRRQRGVRRHRQPLDPRVRALVGPRHRRPRRRIVNGVHRLVASTATATGPTTHSSMRRWA